MNGKKWIRTWFIIIIIIPIVGTFNYTVDPLQHYRQSSWYKPYSFDQRSLVWGLLKNYKFDSVIVGTSMTENFRKTYVDSILGTDVVKASISGASAYEENIVIKEALKKDDLKTVIYGIDLFSFRGESTRLRHGKNSIPLYLINDSLWDDYKYLLSLDTVKNSFKVLIANFTKYKKRNIDYDKFYFWADKNTFSKEKVLKDYKKRLNEENNKFNINDYELKKLIKSFEYNILFHIKSNQNKKFIVFFPPYSILSYKFFQSNGTLNSMIKFKREVLNRLCKYENVDIYDFQIAKNITHNLDLYKDVSHYSDIVNNWMIDNIRDGAYLIHNENEINHNIELLSNQINNYN